VQYFLDKIEKDFSSNLGFSSQSSFEELKRLVYGGLNGLQSKFMPESNRYRLRIGAWNPIVFDREGYSREANTFHARMLPAGSKRRQHSRFFGSPTTRRDFEPD
jgi:hypothetical protein